jgi:hypothetical protein
MPITFTCSNCNARMSVPDQMAGKRGKCSKCKGAIVVPAPANAAPAAARKPGEAPRPAPAEAAPPPEAPVDLEAAAAAALADEVQEEKVVEQIEFICPMCDEPVKLPLDLGGKKHPCPSCRRIIPVPMPKASDRKNWRDTGPKLPSAARRDDGPAPEDAWGTRQMSGPSQEALKQAGVLQEKHKPLTLLQRLRPYLLLATPLLLLGGGWYGWTLYRAAGLEKRSLAYALEMAESEQGAKAVGGPAGQAVLDSYAGRYHLRSQQSGSSTLPGSASKAREEFSKTVARAGRVTGPEVDVLLLETAPAVLQLAGTPDQIESDVRRPMPEVQKLLRAVLAGIRDPDARLEALRQTAAALIAQGEGGRVRPLTLQVYASADADQAEALATVGLEFLRAGKDAEADAVLDEVVGVLKQGEKPEPRAAVVALALARNKKSPTGPGKTPPEIERVQIGEAAGLAWRKQLDQARQRAGKLDNPDGRFRALLEVAVATGQAADVEAALTALTAAKDADVRWATLRLVWLGQQAGLSPEKMEQAVAFLPRALAGWGQLTLLRVRLKASRSVESADALEKIASPLAQQAARVELSWHNTRQSVSWVRTVEGWDEGPRAFGLLGVALGMQSGS